jgi:hypothetical protein
MIKQEVVDIVNARYTVLDIIDLAQYDFQIEKVDQLLSKYTNHTFSVNERILIFHHDTDYYTSVESSGFTVYNLCVLLHRHQIPHEFLIMFTNHYGIEKEVAHLSEQVCNSASFKVVYTSQWYDYPDQSVSNNPVPVIENLFCCLNGHGRGHRVLTLCYFKEHDLLSHGTISYHFKNEFTNYHSLYQI